MLNLDLKLEILKKFRTQADFALTVGDHESKVSQVIRGRRKLSPEEARKWSEALDCGVSMLEPVTQ